MDRANRNTLKENPEFAELLEETSRDLFVGLFPMLLKGDDTWAFEEITDEKVTGDRATLTVSHAGGAPRTISMMKEGGAWKLDSATGSPYFGPANPNAPSLDGYNLK